MDEEYYAQCYNCDVDTQVIVLDEEEPPMYCPMCGSEIVFELLDD